jgi:hypothetical protein
MMDTPADAARNKLPLFTVKEVVITSLLSVGYLSISTLLIGFKTDQLFLVVLFNAMYYLSFPTRRFITGFSIFIAYWIVFDLMKAMPNYNYNAVNIETLYNAEKYLFGITTQAGRVTPNEFFVLNNKPQVDVMAGMFYLCWVPVPLVFAAYLFFKNREQFLYFSLTFFFINLLGFVVYYIYPAAPPWYVQQNGFAFLPGTPGNPAGLQRFDQYFDVGVFKSIYQKSSNVFAAMPSLHSSYPVLVLYYGIKNKVGLMNLVFAIVMAGIWFAAVYTSHHYVLDVLAGIVCALLGITLFNRLLLTNRRFTNFIQWFLLKMNTHNLKINPAPAAPVGSGNNH